MNKNLKIIVMLAVMVFLVGCTIQDSFVDNNVSSGEHEDVDNLPENAQVDFDANIEIDTSVDKLEVSGEIENDGETDNTNNEKENNNDITIEVVPVSGTNLSNTTSAWGFVRKKDGVQPEFSAKYTKALDDYEGIYVGNKETKNIYLTFDEGYENGYTGAILDTLKEKEVPAVFFVTMPYVKQNPDLIKRMIDEGHIVGNHTVNHPSMPSVLDDVKLEEEVTKLHEYVKENFDGYEMTYLRPPKGEYSERTVKICKDLGYTHVLWSSAYDDWDVKKQDRLDYARKMILNYAHNGCVMLLHAVSKDNTALLGEVIDELRNQGYEFKSLDEFEY